MIALLASVSAISLDKRDQSFTDLDKKVHEIAGKKIDRKEADSLKSQLSQQSKKMMEDPKVTQEDLEAVIADYDDLDKAYRYNWELSVYALEPEFHLEVERIKEQLRTYRRPYFSDNSPHDPETWKVENALDYAGSIHN